MDVDYALLQCALFGSSTDVLHSFSLLDLRVHTDCIPGKTVRHEVNSDIGLDEYVTCQELCRYRHSGISILLEI